MLRLLALVVTLAALAAATPRALAEPPAPPAVQILQRAEADPQNTTLLEQLLGEVDKEVAANPKLAVNHYVHGWLLSHLGRGAEAVTAYDRAAELEPGFADALYNCGVVLSDLGRSDEALAHWNAAAEADPKHIDAYYNAAQTYYNRHQYKDALERWQKALALDPGDFDVQKKVLQAFNGLHERAGATKAREALLALWRDSDDPRVKAMTEFCFDQREVGKVHVYAYETLDPKGDLFYPYTFKLAGPDNRIFGSVRLESSAVIREAGTPYILGFSSGATHATTRTAYKTLPSYGALWPDVEKIIRKEFASAVQ